VVIGAINMYKMVAVVNSASFNSGLGRYAYFLYDALKPNSVLINLRLDKNIIFNHGETINGFIPPITSGWLINSVFYGLAFNRQFKVKEKDAVIHYASMGGKPVENSIATIHDLFFLEFEDNHSFVNRKILTHNLKYYKKLDNIITVSEHVKKQLIDNGFEGKITRIYPPVSDDFTHIEDKNKIRDQLSLPREKILILVVATTQKRKNLKILEQLKLDDSFRIISVGGGIKDAITFRNVDEKKLNQIYNACDLLLSPSLDEGFGFPVVEAMKVGLPVVASDIEIYNETTMGKAILVDNSDVSAIKIGIKEALSNKESLSIEGRKFAIKYGFQNFKEEILKFYSRISHNLSLSI
jgi:glycosyltransferase involved in cell wall biosynthesis